MRAYITNIEETTLQNTDYRRVLFTAKNSQLVVMCIKPGDEIGKETHHLDQFIRIEEGTGMSEIDGEQHELRSEFALVIPAGTAHNIINTGSTDMKLYSLYSPPEHMFNTVHPTKESAVEEHFDGTLSFTE